MSLTSRLNRIFSRKEVVSDSKPSFITPTIKKERFEISSVPVKGEMLVKELTPEEKKASEVIATSNVKFFDETFNPYRFSQFRELYTFDEPSFYRDYRNSYTQNPYTKMVIEYLMNEIFANDYHFEGPGAKDVEEFFKLDNTRQKIKVLVREGLVKGNGFMDVAAKGGKGKRTRVLDTESISIVLDPKTGDRIYSQAGTILKPDYLLHFLTHEVQGFAYGRSLLRANIMYLTALLDAGGDSVAALKRVAYAPIIAKLDLEGYRDEDKKEVIDKFTATLKEMQSATNNFVVDKRHEMTLLGQGGGNAKLLPTNQIIEPILSVILINFGIPLGIYIQTGANKSIIQEQRLAMQRFYDDLRGKIKYAIEQKVVPYITKTECFMVFNKPPITAPETQEAFKLHIEAFKNGLLTREYILDYWDIEDTGSTFYQPPLKDSSAGDSASKPKPKEKVKKDA